MKDYYFKGVFNSDWYALPDCNFDSTSAAACLYKHVDTGAYLIQVEQDGGKSPGYRVERFDSQSEFDEWVYLMNKNHSDLGDTVIAWLAKDTDLESTFEGFLGTVGRYYGWTATDPYVNLDGKLVAVYSHRGGSMGIQVEDIDGNINLDFYGNGFKSRDALIDWLTFLPDNIHTFSEPALKALTPSKYWKSENADD